MDLLNASEPAGQQPEITVYHFDDYYALFRQGQKIAEGHNGPDLVDSIIQYITSQPEVKWVNCDVLADMDEEVPQLEAALVQLLETEKEKEN